MVNKWSMARTPLVPRQTKVAGSGENPIEFLCPADHRFAGGALGSNPFDLCTIVPVSSSAAGSVVVAAAGRACEPLMSGGSVAGLTGVNAAPCADLPVNANSPSLVETMSPGRKVGSRLTSNEVSPNASLPLQVQLATSCLRYKNAVSSAL